MLNHVMVGSNDIERSKKFYTEVLGFRVRDRATVPGGLQLAYLDLGGTTVELMCYSHSKPVPAQREEHLGVGPSGFGVLLAAIGLIAGGWLRWRKRARA